MAQPAADRIVAVLHDFIQDERKRNFDFLGRYTHYYKDPGKLLVVEPASTDNVSGVHWFTLTEPPGAYSCRTVAIKALDKENIAIESLVIGKKTDNMCDAATWLRRVYCFDHETSANCSDLQYQEQAWWWATTGKSFRLLHLPLELRELIYLAAIGPVCVPDMTTVGGQQKLFLGVGQSFPKRSKAEQARDPDVPPPNLSILRLNKQVHMEATMVANCIVVKRFTTLHSGQAKGPRSSASELWNPSLLTSQCRLGETSFLRRIQLEMPATDYFASIGIRPRTGSPLATAACEPLDLKHLFRLDGLRDLDLRFISPAHKLASCPWANLDPARQLHSCQLRWTTLFLILAWNTLRQLHVQKRVRISLSGCIKNSSRAFWSKKLNSPGVNDAPLVQGMEKKVRAVMKKHDSHTVLRCTCTNPCAVELVEGKKSAFADHRDPMLSRVEGWQDLLDTAYWDFER